MRIGALSRATGVDIETIRFYEKSGLMPGPSRSDNGYRDYAQSHLERLAFIRHCRALDISLADIGLLLGSLNSRDAAQLAAVDSLVDAQLARVRARLASMRALEQQLVTLKARCDGQHAAHDDQGCGILAELVAAAHGEACACHTAETHPEHPATLATTPQKQAQQMKEAITPVKAEKDR